MNSSLCLGIALVNLVALFILPSPEDGDEALLQDENWRIVYALPIVLCEIIPMVLIVLFFRVPSINEIMSKNEKELLDQQLKKIFIIKNEEDLKKARAQIYAEQIVVDESDKDKEDINQVTLWEACINEKYRFATLNV